MNINIRHKGGGGGFILIMLWWATATFAEYSCNYRYSINRENHIFTVGLTEVKTRVGFFACDCGKLAPYPRKVASLGEIRADVRRPGHHGFVTCFGACIPQPIPSNQLPATLPHLRQFSLFSVSPPNTLLTHLRNPGELTLDK